jgi:recombination protein RecA
MDHAGNRAHDDVLSGRTGFVKHATVASMSFRGRAAAGSCCHRLREIVTPRANGGSISGPRKDSPIPIASPGAPGIIGADLNLISTTEAMPAKPAPASTSGEDRLAAARAKNLDAALQQIQKDFGEGSIMRLGDNRKMDIEVIPSGNLLIDRALGAGGFPRGRIMEVFGPESSGKTTLTLTVIAQAQKRGGLAAFIDVEHALDPEYAKKLGVKLDDLLVSQPSSGEEALRICETLVRSNALDVIVLDSVAALITKAELEGEIGDSTVGAQARLMSAAMRKLTALISKARTVCIFTNQIREKIGVMFGNPETTPGGRALKFFSSVRIDVRRIGQIKNSDGTVTGSRTKIKVVKNKIAPPFGEAEFDIMYDEGVSNTGSLLDLALEQEILQKRGSWISYKGSQLAQGRDAAKEILKNDPVIYAEIEAAVKDKLGIKGSPATGQSKIPDEPIRDEM